MSRDRLKKNKKILSIVTVTYNNRREIGNFLSALNEQNLWLKGYRVEFILIDNKSNDETLLLARKYLKKLPFLHNSTLIQNSENVGFSKSVNQGIRQSTGSLILLINPDTILMGRNTLYKLLKCLMASSACIVGGMLLKKKEVDDHLSSDTVHGSYVRKPGILTGIFEFTNIKKIWKSNPFFRNFYYLDEKKPYESKYVDAVSGAFMLIKRDVIDKIGFFDENFFMYLEDIDFCLRARAIGLNVFFCSAAMAYHYAGASSRHIHGRINYDAWKQSRRHFFKKQLPHPAFIFLWLLFFLDEVVINLHARIRRFRNKRE